MIQQTSCQQPREFQFCDWTTRKQKLNRSHLSPTCGKLNCVQVRTNKWWFCTATHWNAPPLLWKASVNSGRRWIIHLLQLGIFYRIYIPTCQNIASFPFCHKVSWFCQIRTFPFHWEAAICLQLAPHVCPSQQRPAWDSPRVQTWSPREVVTPREFTRCAGIKHTTGSEKPHSLFSG